ncbi:MAG: C4-type zinc ribbon domain-containing protein [Candidatus Omnitrophota bacterium]
MDSGNLKNQLENLIKLQAVDKEIYALNLEKTAMPEKIKEAQACFEAKKQNLQDLEKKSLDLQKYKKDRELELASYEENAKKLQGQLFQLKTNKDYQAMQQQIKEVKADSSVIEDKVLQIMEKVDVIKSDIEKEKLKVQAEEKVFNEEKNKINNRIKEIDDRLSQLDAQRKQNIPSIEPGLFSQYEKVLINREGVAIVEVKNNCCQGCNMSMPPQVINQIRMYENIVICEFCSRILYVESE